LPRGEKSKAEVKKETYGEYCNRCKLNYVMPLPLAKWEALQDIKSFKFFK
jgi:hypothetical protein